MTMENTQEVEEMVVHKMDITIESLKWISVVFMQDVFHLQC